MLLEKTFDTGEITLSYAEGPPAGPPLVLLHGLTGNRFYWDPFIPHLTPSWHLYACDLRGHGKSGRVANHYHVPDYVRDIVAFLRHQVGEPAVLLGASLGALTALGTAAQLPTHTRALVLLDPPLFVRNASIESRPDAKDWFSWVYETTTTAHSRTEVVLRCRERMAAAPEAEIQRVADMISGVAPDVPATALHDRILEGIDLTHALQQVVCPTLLITGDQDHGSHVRDEDVEFVQANLSRAIIVKVPTMGHSPEQQEQVEMVLQHIRNFPQ